MVLFAVQVLKLGIANSGVFGIFGEDSEGDGGGLIRVYSELAKLTRE